MTRILLVEDHLLVAQGLELGLRAEGFEVLSTDGTPAALSSALADFAPDVVLLDLHLADGRSGISLIPMLHAPGRTVIVLTAETEATALAGALRAGVDAVLGKTMPFDHLIREIQAISQGRSVEAEYRRHQVMRDARATEQQRAQRRAPFADLTQREEQVLAMLIDGVQAADIAERSYVSLATVRSHIHAILTKLGVSSQVSAVSVAIRAEWAPARRPGR